eukprot:5211654-Prymnesium_polylepis.1
MFRGAQTERGAAGRACFLITGGRDAGGERRGLAEHSATVVLVGGADAIVQQLFTLRPGPRNRQGASLYSSGTASAVPDVPSVLGVPDVP